MRNELIDLYKLACANPQDKDIVRAYQSARDRIGPQIAIHEALDNDALRARVARLEEALKRGVELHENCDADTCMCGEPMHHPLSGHMPVAMLQYYGDQWAEEARRALEEK